MTTGDYLPVKDDMLVNRFTNFAANFVQHVTNLGFVAADATNINNDLATPLARNTPELRKYRAVYYKVSATVGTHSDVVTVSMVR